MSLLFSLRGNSFSPRYAKGGKDFFHYLAAASLGSPPVVKSDFTDPSVFGGSALTYTLVGDTRATIWTARKHWPRNSRVFSLRIRIVPAFTGLPPYVQRPIRIGSYGGAAEAVGGMEWEFQENGTLYVRVRSSVDQLSDIAVFTTSHVFSFNNGVGRDVMITCDGSRIYMSEEGVEVYNEAVSNQTANHFLHDIMAGKIFIGTYPCNLYVNELSIWDTCEPHVYSPRTGFLACDDVDGVTSVGAGAENIRAGVTETINGELVTGTCEVPDPSDVLEGVPVDDTEGTYEAPPAPLAADLRLGVVVGAVTGTCAVPVASNVRNGTAVGAGTGTLKVPNPNTVLAGVQTDDTVGTLAPPDAADLREGTVAVGVTGTLAVPDPSDVRAGVPVDDTVGTLGIQYRKVAVKLDAPVKSVKAGPSAKIVTAQAQAKKVVAKKE